MHFGEKEPFFAEKEVEEHEENDQESPREEVKEKSGNENEEELWAALTRRTNSSNFESKE